MGLFNSRARQDRVDWYAGGSWECGIVGPCIEVYGPVETVLEELLADGPSA